MDNVNTQSVSSPILTNSYKSGSEPFIWFLITLGLILFTFAGGKIVANLPLTTLVRLIGLIIFATIIGTFVSVKLALHLDRYFAVRLFLTAFAIRLLTGITMGLYLLETNGTPLFQDDTKLFQEQALEIISGEIQWIPGVFSGPSIIYASIYKLVGDNSPFLSLVPNILLSALTPVFVWRIVQELKISESIARNSAWLMTLLPVTVIYSSTHLKEGTTAFAITLLLYLVVTKFHRPYYLTLIMALPFLFVVFLYRDRLGLPLLFLFFIGMGITNKNGRFSITSLIVWLIIPCALAILGLRLGLWIRKQGVIERVFLTGWYILENQPRSLFSPKAFLSGFKTNPLIILLFSPISALYILLLPLPWFALNEGMYFEVNLLSIANTAWLILIPLFFLGCVHLWRQPNKVQRLPVLLSWGGLLSMAFSLDELGMMGRHKEIFMPFMLILIEAGWENFRSWQASSKYGLIAITILCFFLISVLYLCAKVG